MPVHQRNPQKGSGDQASRIADQPNLHSSRLPYLSLRSWFSGASIQCMELPHAQTRIPARVHPVHRAPRYGGSKVILLLFLVLASLNLPGCKSFFRPEIPTGVERRVLSDGSLELVVTGQASKLALEKDSVAMKQTTSREAARLLLEVELQSGNYPGHKERFEIQSVEFLYDFEYCIIKGKYKKK